ncbi:hypothetical protein D3C87_1802030 [compost metagenome]
MIAVVIDVVDAYMADAVELGANACPAHHQFIIEGEFVRAHCRAARLARLDVS